MNIPQIFTGNVGDPTTRIIPFASAPIITSSPYIWKTALRGTRNAKSTDGSRVYPTGTYTFAVTQDLNGMSSSYRGDAATGTVISGNKTVTFIADTFTSSPTMLPSPTTPVETAAATAGTTTPSQQLTTQPTATVIPEKDDLFSSFCRNPPYRSWHCSARNRDETEVLIVKIPFF